MAYLNFNDGECQTVTNDITQTWSMTSIEYNNTCEIIKIKNTKTDSKTQFLPGYSEDDFTIEVDYDDEQTLPRARDWITATGTFGAVEDPIQFVIEGYVQKVSFKGGNNEQLKASFSFPGTLTTKL